MSVFLYGMQFRCDLCGVMSDRQPVSNITPINYASEPVPDGWTNLGLLTITLQDAYGLVFRELCGTCGALSIGELAVRMRAQHEKENTDADLG
jgi:hypothetical protein